MHFNQGAAEVGSLIVFGVGLLIVFMLFLLMREIWCWYWKINQAMERLYEIQQLLRNIDRNVAARPTAPTVPAGAEPNLFAEPIR
jgi:hypothetical protein